MKCSATDDCTLLISGSTSRRYDVVEVDGGGYELSKTGGPEDITTRSSLKCSVVNVVSACSMCGAKKRQILITVPYDEFVAASLKRFNGFYFTSYLTALVDEHARSRLPLCREYVSIVEQR